MKHYTAPRVILLSVPAEDILTASFAQSNEGLGDSIHYDDLTRLP